MRYIGGVYIRTLFSMLFLQRVFLVPLFPTLFFPALFFSVAFFPRYFRQNIGENSTSRVKISSRPRAIVKQSSSLAASDISA